MSYFLCDEFQKMEPYIPGEQPKDQAYIKLNANESSLPPSPRVFDAVSQSRIRGMGHYADPHCKQLRKAIGDVYGVNADRVFVGNGADEVLGFCFMSFFSPRMKLCFPDITYDFYRTYAKTNRIDFEQIPLDADFHVNVEDYIATDRDIVLANPNNPTGLALSVSDIERIVAVRPKRLVIIDEAYIDYGNESCIPLTEKYANLIVVQTFSKSRNLAGARIGFAIASKEIIEDMNKIKFTFNPFNMSALALAAGSAAVQDTAYLEKCVHSVLATRVRVQNALEKMNFFVAEPHANFLFVSHPYISGGKLCKMLKERGILVRHYNEARIRDYVRITIGTDREMDKVLQQLHEILQEVKACES
ncbi:histidinol-phosphate transaminase [Sporolactobacillus sp. STCC-11]|uniref:histidinol-phosphate transaminase n=1 Tax=Sporolactobacillus caesalpiniae TaxID=3230362 RepID=UPI00339664A1